jgi:catechol 2,3-dioxygenase-like lactoylglutathione lyase family enzyme
MKLGAFSISLAVRNLEASREFYEKLGFEVVHGVQEEGWLILRNGDHAIGLFQGMFDKNMLTFNPGWGALGAELDEFADVRELRDRFIDAGIEVTGDETTQESADGPASFMVVDPDGNPILFDQHR